MKRLLFIMVLAVVFSAPLWGFSQRIQGGTLADKGTFNSLNLAPPSQNNIPTPILLEILTQAAPYFGYTPEDFISLYYTCGCIDVEQVGSNIYRVTYGGLGIQIIIDGSRISGGTGSLTGRR